MHNMYIYIYMHVYILMHIIWLLEGKKILSWTTWTLPNLPGSWSNGPLKAHPRGISQRLESEWKWPAARPVSNRWLVSWLIGWWATVGLLILGQNGLGPPKLPPAGGHHRGDCQQGGGVVVFVGHDRHRQCHHQHCYQYH